jgi:protein TonB
MPAIRLPISFSLSCLTTVALFWFLGLLVAGVPPGEPIPTIGRIEFTNLVPETETIRIVRVKPEIPKPDLVPERPGIVVDPLPDVLPRIDTSPLELPDSFGPGRRGPLAPGDRGIPSTGGADRGPLPQVRIEPDYPQVAMARGIEGWITFRFTITREGRVKDVVILAADPPRIFDAATIRAVSSWRYQPRMKDGSPVEQPGVTATYRFELDR